MHFIQVDIESSSDYTEILIAELSEINYDSFWENEIGFIAYVEDQYFDEGILKELMSKYPEANMKYQFEGMESKNWNEEWEKNFQPIVVADACYVRSTFHDPRPEFRLEVVIEPKMSFGTGHHATTSLMIEQLLETNLKEKSLMDVGCGTAILSITASKLGSNPIFSYDIDDWAVTNSFENIELNNIKNIIVLKGLIKDFPLISKFDVILANITKNVIIEEISRYIQALNRDGQLILSGFYEKDIDDILKEIPPEIIKSQKIKIKDSWASIALSLL